jgi:hypothetical protein
MSVNAAAEVEVFVEEEAVMVVVTVTTVLAVVMDMVLGLQVRDRYARSVKRLVTVLAGVGNDLIVT